jgi:hypothetical protein
MVKDMTKLFNLQCYIILKAIEDYYKLEGIKEEILKELNYVAGVYLYSMHNAEAFGRDIAKIESKYGIKINFEFTPFGSMSLNFDCNSIKI